VILAELASEHQDRPNCWLQARGVGGLLFRMDEDRVVALSAEERNADAAKKQRKEHEAAERAAFIERARRHVLEPGDERFWGEVEALALGHTQNLGQLPRLVPEKIPNRRTPGSCAQASGPPGTTRTPPDRAIHPGA